MELIVTKNFSKEDSYKLSVYEKDAGYSKFVDLLKSEDKAKIIEEVKLSGLRGRGGAGFPTGLKWTFLPKDTNKPKYLCCNADEGEPGTFKDRDIMRYDPHLLIDGIAITCWALDINEAYIYIRGEFLKEIEIVDKALEEAYGAGYLGKNIKNSGFSLDIYTHTGAGAYICGEETSLLDSLEGKRGNPRLRPPYPAVEGLYGCPTVVNNVETLANVRPIVEKGADWFKKFGTEKSAGTKIFCVSGHVKKPGNYELPLGVNLLELINENAGGLEEGRKLKAVIPGGVSAPVLSASECDLNLDFESVADAGSMLGSGAVIVMDDRTSMPHALKIIMDFFAHESCGQCSQCREGTKWIADITKRIITGKGRVEDLDLMVELACNMEGKTVCVFSDAAAAPVKSFVKKFRSEFEDYIKSAKSGENIVKE